MSLLHLKVREEFPKMKYFTAKVFRILFMQRSAFKSRAYNSEAKKFFGKKTSNNMLNATSKKTTFFRMYPRETRAKTRILNNDYSLKNENKNEPRISGRAWREKTY